MTRKTMTGIPTDCEGNIVGSGRPVSGRTPRGKQTDFPVTYVTTRRQRIARKLWG